MKKNIICVVLLLSIFAAAGQQNNLFRLMDEVPITPKPYLPYQPENDGPVIQKNIAPVRNLFIITLDGFRWQELFNGADSLLIGDDNFTPACATLKTLYWAATPEERRKILMPFFWNVIGANGQVYGNRFYDNKMDVANSYAMSYPGYNEMFTGIPDPDITSNKKTDNPNNNVLAYLNTIPEFMDKVAAFTSWDVFPYIFNKDRANF